MPDVRSVLSELIYRVWFQCDQKTVWGCVCVASKSTSPHRDN